MIPIATTVQTAGGYGPPPGGGPPGGAPPGGYGGPPPGGPPPGGMPPGGYGGPPPGGMPPGGMPPGGMPPGGMPPGGMPPGGMPPGGYGGPPPGGPPPGGMPPGGFGGPPPGGMPPGGFGGAPPKKGKGGLIAILVIVFVVLLASLAGVLYFTGVIGGGKSASVAHEHLPKSCQAVVRIDVRSLLKVRAIKKHVIPAIDEKAKNSDDADKLARFLITAELNPKKDLDEVVLCAKNLDSAEPTVVAVVGGDLKPNGIIEAIKKHSKKGKFKKPKKVKGLEVLEGEDEPVFVTQAKDAALLIGNKLSLVKTAAKTRDAYKDKYKLPLDEQIVAIITADAVKNLASKGGPRNPFADKLAGAGRLLLTASLDTGKVSGRLSMGKADQAKELAEAIKGFIDMMKQAPGGIGGGDPTAKAIMENATINADGNDVLVSFKIPKKAITKAAKEFAKGIRRADKEL